MDYTTNTTKDMEEAFDKLDSVVQCGDCYVYYSAVEHNGICPICNSDEWVGSR